MCQVALFPTTVNQESLGRDFDPTYHLNSDPEKMSYGRNSVRNIAKMMCKETKARTTQNLENVAGHLPSDRVYTVCGDKLFLIFLILD